MVISRWFVNKRKRDSNTTGETIQSSLHEEMTRRPHAEVENDVLSSRVFLVYFPAILVPNVWLVPLIFSA